MERKKTAPYPKRARFPNKNPGDKSLQQRRKSLDRFRANVTEEELKDIQDRATETKRKLNPPPTRRKDLVGHRLKIIDETTERIKTSLHAEGVSYIELARRLDMTPGHISHLLSGTRNMTLATLADIAEAIGYEFTLVPVKKGHVNGRGNKSSS